MDYIRFNLFYCVELNDKCDLQVRSYIQFTAISGLVVIIHSMHQVLNSLYELAIYMVLLESNLVTSLDHT